MWVLLLEHIPRHERDQARAVILGYVWRLASESVTSALSVSCGEGVHLSWLFALRFHVQRLLLVITQQLPRMASGSVWKFREWIPRTCRKDQRVLRYFTTHAHSFKKTTQLRGLPLLRQFQCWNGAATLLFILKEILQILIGCTLGSQRTT